MRCLLTIMSCPVLAIVPCVAAEDGAAANRQIQLPGMVINLTKKFVDLEATVCVTDGLLELVACTKGSKEHESIVSVTARAMHIHTGLLAIGATNGRPSTRQKVNSDEERWVQIPAHGDRIRIMFVVNDQGGKPVERPVRDFVLASRERIDEVDGKVLVAPESKTSSNQPLKVFPETFVFAGSMYRKTEQPPHPYSADLSGNVISIATFGDEVLCLPTQQSHNNRELYWRANPNTLPKRGTKITLRLRTVPKQSEKTNPTKESSK